MQMNGETRFVLTINLDRAEAQAVWHILEEFLAVGRVGFYAKTAESFANQLNTTCDLGRPAVCEATE